MTGTSFLEWYGTISRYVPRRFQFHNIIRHNLSRIMTKPTKWHVHPAKTQISLGIRLVWSESSLCARWVAKDPSFLHVDSEDSDQTGQIPRLIWVFAGRTATFLIFSWGDSFFDHMTLSIHSLLAGVAHQFYKRVKGEQNERNFIALGLSNDCWSLEISWPKDIAEW